MTFVQNHDFVDSLLKSRLTPLASPVREQRFITAYAGDFLFNHYQRMQNTKENIRQKALSKRRALGHDKNMHASTLITRAIINSNYYKKAKTIGCYLSMKDEVNTALIIKEIEKTNKLLFLPKIQADGTINFIQINKDSNYSTNRYGIKEPADDKDQDIEKIDLIIMPLVAFDSIGNRIGMGGGYYDKKFQYLLQNNNKPSLIGIAFDCQYYKKIQSDIWDVSLDHVFTESGCIF